MIARAAILFVYVCEGEGGSWISITDLTNHVNLTC